MLFVRGIPNFGFLFVPPGWSAMAFVAFGAAVRVRAASRGAQQGAGLGQAEASWDEFLGACRSRLGLEPGLPLRLYAHREWVEVVEVEALEELAQYTLTPGAPPTALRAAPVRRKGHNGSGVAPAGGGVPSWDPVVVRAPGGYRAYFLRDPELPEKDRTGEFWLHSWTATTFSKEVPSPLPLTVPWIPLPPLVFIQNTPTAHAVLSHILEGPHFVEQSRDDSFPRVGVHGGGDPVSRPHREMGQQLLFF